MLGPRFTAADSVSMSFSMAARPSAPLSPRHQKGLADEVVEPVAKKPGYSSEDAWYVCVCVCVVWILLEIN